MDLTDRIKSFELLGDRLCRYHEQSGQEGFTPLLEAATDASAANRWFTPELITVALNNLGKMLTGDNLNRWLSVYEDRLKRAAGQKTIGVVMAGNIPAVGFHDFLCVLISGHKLVAKLSSSDDKLLPAMASVLIDHDKDWQDVIRFTSGRLENFDAIIATGNSNTSKYFEFYFGKYPHIIRRNRNSIAVINGNESNIELQHLAGDIMLFFGMGCRSISKICVPAGYDFSPLIKSLGKYEDYANHNKYRNNYDYYKSIFMVSQVPFIDTGFLLLKEDAAIASRIAVLHYQYYDHPDDIVQGIRQSSEEIQCVISNTILPVETKLPGEGQIPALWDYADHIDTMEFLLSAF